MAGKLGLARLEALVEALDRDLDLTGATISNASIVKAVVACSAATTLTAAQSGAKILLEDGSGYVVKLPADAINGTNFELIYTGLAAEAHDITIDTQSDARFFKGAIQILDTDESGDGSAIIAPNGSSNSKVALKTVEPGTRLECVFDGTSWYLTGLVCTATGTGAVYADQ